MNALNKILKTEAMKHGLCKQWTTEWSQDCTDEELVDKYIRGLDFCIQHNYPDNDFIRKNFDLQFLRSKNLFVDDDGFRSGHQSGTYVVQGDSLGELHFSGCDAATVWVRHESEVFIRVSGLAFVMVHCYDDCHVTIERHGDARVSVRRHSSSCEIFQS